MRRALGLKRVGHLGTLDPFADGLLVLVTGRATRLAPFAAGWPKDYEGVIRFGVATDTDDGTGRVVATSETWRDVSRSGIAAALAGLTGERQQRPPAYSAVKIAGERAHRRARRGETVEPEPRTVTVHALELVEWAPPDARFRAVVSAGTYIRSLARDAGDGLGCGAHLVALTRTRVGPFALAAAVAPQAVTAGDVHDPGILVQDLARCDLDPAQRDAVVHGRPLPRGTQEAGRVALFAEGRLVAVAEPEGDVWKPRVVLEG